jgi:hypothetical protein
MTAEAVREAFEAQGRFWFRGGVSEPTLSFLDATALLEGAVGARPDLTEELRDVLSRAGGPGGLLTVFGEQLAPVRIVAFNKTVETNWAVSWHQDRVIAVAERHDVPGYGSWTKKGGVWHCEPPQEVLDRMYFVRVHLDDCGPDDGAMRIAVGSHRLGPIPEADARRVAEELPQEDCGGARGDVLVLKMLTLHGSSASKTTRPRRVLRIDYAPSQLLPPPLAWL